jgi:Concanavalin A-like lectin/glucanases superfamily
MTEISRSYRVPRSPVDNFFQKGPPPPPTRMGSGEVLAISADTCTVLLHGTQVPGVAVQGNMPAVGDQIDIWNMEDLVYTPGAEDGWVDDGTSDAPHIVSSDRPSISDQPVNIGGSFHDESWFFEAVDEPDWRRDAREDLTGLEVSRDGTDTDGILWSGVGFDVRVGNELHFTITADWLDFTPASMQLVVCYGADPDVAPLPGDDTDVRTHGSPVLIDGVDETLDVTWVVPEEVHPDGGGGTFDPVIARVGILFHVEPPPAGSRVAFWAMDDSTGTTMADSSGDGHDGTFFNSPTLGATGVTDTGTSVNLTNTPTGAFETLGSQKRAQVDYGSWMPLPSTPWSLSVWFATATGIGTGRTLCLSSRGVDWEGTGRKVVAFQFHVAWDFTNSRYSLKCIQTWYNGFTFQQSLVAAGDQAGSEPTHSITLGTDYHAVTTFDGSVLRVYLNGVLVHATTGPWAPDADVVCTYPLQIGVVYGSNRVPPRDYNQFPGRIDEVGYYDYALSPAEISALYAGGS